MLSVNVFENINLILRCYRCRSQHLISMTEDHSRNLTGDISRNLTRDCSGNLTVGDCSGNFTVGDCSENLTVGDCSGNLTAGDCSSDLTAGNCSGNLITSRSLTRDCLNLHGDCYGRSEIITLIMILLHVTIKSCSLFFQMIFCLFS